eukprot:3461705-Rhodomonas_salina.3
MILTATCCRHSLNESQRGQPKSMSSWICHLSSKHPVSHRAHKMDQSNILTFPVLLCVASFTTANFPFPSAATANFSAVESQVVAQAEAKQPRTLQQPRNHHKKACRTQCGQTGTLRRVWQCRNKAMKTERCNGGAHSGC